MLSPPLTLWLSLQNQPHSQALGSFNNIGFEPVALSRDHRLSDSRTCARFVPEDLGKTDVTWPIGRIFRGKVLNLYEDKWILIYCSWSHCPSDTQHRQPRSWRPESRRPRSTTIIYRCPPPPYNEATCSRRRSLGKIPLLSWNNRQQGILHIWTKYSEYSDNHLLYYSPKRPFKHFSAQKLQIIWTIY